MGSANSLPAPISLPSIDLNNTKIIQTNNANRVRTIVNIHTTVRDFLDYANEIIKNNGKTKTFEDGLRNLKSVYDDYVYWKIWNNTDKTYNLAISLEKTYTNFFTTYITPQINSLQTLVNDTINVNAKFNNYSYLYAGITIPQSEKDHVNTLISNFRNSPTKANALERNTVNTILVKWIAWNKNNVTVSQNLINRAISVQQIAGAKIGDLEQYGPFQGNANTLRGVYDDFNNYYNAYTSNPNNTTHQNLENKIGELNTATQNAGNRSANDEGLRSKANTAKVYADAKIGDLAQYNPFLGKSNELRDSDVYQHFQHYWNAYHNNPTNDTAGNLNRISDGLNQGITNAGTRYVITDINNRAINAQTTAGAKIGDLRKYNPFQANANTLNGVYDDFAAHYKAYTDNPTDQTHKNLDSKIGTLNQATSNAGNRTVIQDLINSANTAQGSGWGKIVDLESYNKYGNYQANVNTLRPVYDDFNNYYKAYTDNPTDQTHQDLVSKIGTLNTATQNAGNRSANAELLQSAAAAISDANGKSTIFNTYKIGYPEPPKIDTTRLNNAINTYNGNPNNETHAELESAITELKGKNVPSMTGLPAYISAAETEITTAKQKKTLLQSYSDAYSDNIDYSNLVNLKNKYSNNPSDTLHSEFDKEINRIRDLNKGVTITSSGDLIAKAQAQIDRGNTKSQEYQQNTAYVNFVSSLKKPISDCQTAKDAYEKVQNNETDRKIKSTTIALKDAIDGVPTITTPKPTPLTDLLTNAELQMDAGTKLSKLLQNNLAYVNFVSTLNKPMKECDTAYTAYIENPNTDTATTLVNATGALKSAISDVPTITTPKPTPLADLVKKVENKLDEGTKLSNELQKNTAYASFAVSLSTPIQDCEAALVAYQNNPKISTAEKLDITYNTLELAISAVPTRTAPKPTPNSELVKEVDKQIKLGNELSTEFQKNNAYLNVGLGLNNFINACQISRQAYIDNPTDTTAQNLVNSTNTLKQTIKEVPTITNTKPTSNIDVLEPVPTPTSISFTTIPTTGLFTSTPTTFTSIPTTGLFTSTPTTITTMFGGAVTLNPAADTKIVGLVDNQIKIADNKLAEIKNNISLATKEPFGTDLESQINDLKSKLQDYKLNPTMANQTALMESAGVLTETMNKINGLSVYELLNNLPMYRDILGSSIISTLTSPMPSTYGPTSTMAPGSTYGPTSTMAPGSTYGPTSTMAPGSTYGPTSTMAPGSTYGPTSTMAPGSTYGPTSTMAPGSTYGPTSTMAPGSTYGPTSTMAPGSTYGPSIENDEEPTSMNENVYRPTSSQVYNNSSPTPYVTAYSCPTFNCAPYQTTVPPTTPPHKCQTCYSCRRCHKCNKHHKCHRKTPTNTNYR